jgi:hypothetical protein
VLPVGDGHRGIRVLSGFWTVISVVVAGCDSFLDDGIVSVLMETIPADKQEEFEKVATLDGLQQAMRSLDMHSLHIVDGNIVMGSVELANELGVAGGRLVKDYFYPDDASRYNDLLQKNRAAFRLQSRKAGIWYSALSNGQIGHLFSIHNLPVISNRIPTDLLVYGAIPTVALKKAWPGESRREANGLSDLDLSAFPPTITNYGKNKPISQLQARRAADEMEPRPLKKFHEAKEHHEIFGKVDEHMRTYGDNSRPRAVCIHRDWEERWMERKLNGRPYSDFVRTRTRAKTELKPCGTTMGLGSGPVYNALTEAEVVELPYVQIPTTHRRSDSQVSEARAARAGVDADRARKSGNCRRATKAQREGDHRHSGLVCPAGNKVLCPSRAGCSQEGAKAVRSDPSLANRGRARSVLTRSM